MPSALGGAGRHSAVQGRGAGGIPRSGKGAAANRPLVPVGPTKRADHRGVRQKWRNVQYRRMKRGGRTSRVGPFPREDMGDPVRTYYRSADVLITDEVFA